MHYLVMVFGNDPFKQMKKFNARDSNLWTAAECLDALCEYEKEQTLNYYNSKGLTFASFEECYEKFGYDYNYNSFRKHDDGIWYYYHVYNPNSEYDTIQLGGRYSNWLILKPESEQFSNIKYDRERDINCALLGDIDIEAMRNDAEKTAREEYPTDYGRNCTEEELVEEYRRWAFVPTAFVIDGTWYPIEEDEEMRANFEKILANQPQDTLITIFDTHF